MYVRELLSLFFHHGGAVLASTNYTVLLNIHPLGRGTIPEFTMRL
jgi:hypothetical protein